jgi:hypothetical protein
VWPVCIQIGVLVIYSPTRMQTALQVARTTAQLNDCHELHACVHMRLELRCLRSVLVTVCHYQQDPSAGPLQQGLAGTLCQYADAGLLQPNNLIKVAYNRYNIFLHVRCMSVHATWPGPEG